MKKLKVGNVNAYFIENNEKLPDLCGMPEGIAACVYRDDDCSDLDDITLRRVISAKYRVKEQSAEDVRLRLVVASKAFVRKLDRAESIEMLPTAYIVPKGDCLSAIAYISSRQNEVTDAVVVDCAAKDRYTDASNFGSAAAKLLGVADYRAECLLGSEKYDRAAASDFRKCILAGIASSKAPDDYTIAQKAAKIDYFTRPGGESFFSAVLNAMLRHESRKTLPDGVARLLAANVIVETYKQFVISDFGLITPPDNNARIEALCDYLGWDERSLLSIVRLDLTENQIKRSLYAVKNCRAELLAELCYDGAALAVAARKIKRLMPDYGYDLYGSFGFDDLRLAFALAPDFGGGKIYTLMKSMGLTDAFI